MLLCARDAVEGERAVLDEVVRAVRLPCELVDSRRALPQGRRHADMPLVVGRGVVWTCRPEQNLLVARGIGVVRYPHSHRREGVCERTGAIYIPAPCVRRRAATGGSAGACDQPSGGIVTGRRVVVELEVAEVLIGTRLVGSDRRL